MDGAHWAALRFSIEEIREFSADDRLVHFVGRSFPEQPGILRFRVRLEYFHFSPKTPRHCQFVIHEIIWRNKHWTVISIPKADMETAKKVASEVGVAITQESPLLQDGDERRDFPFKGKNVFSLKGFSAQDYANDPDKLPGILIKEYLEAIEISEKSKISLLN